MEVQELIDKLSQLPPDAEIHFEGGDDEVQELIDEFISEAIPSEVNVKQNWQLLPLKEE